MPECIKLAIKAWVAYLYEHRGDDDAPAAMPGFVRDLLAARITAATSNDMR